MQPKYRIQIIPHLLRFKKPAGTSRGVYHTHQIWYVVVSLTENHDRWGIGECAPLPNLSCDASPEYENILKKVCQEIMRTGDFDKDALRAYPSILFGLETAFRHFEVGSFSLWETQFSKGEEGITINGLIWMDDYRKMLIQIEEKMKVGFQCVKLKIGAIDFDDELSLLRHIRSHFSSKEIELRVDANGAFFPKDALDKLNRLAEFDIHSIEQPIKAGQWEEMHRLTEKTPIPIALDEELIGHNDWSVKKELLTAICPQYIILKPSLHGGFTGCKEWINEAELLGIDWWLTSALESNIGLNAIAQWCGTLKNPLPQGLGTGGLFFNNQEIPLTVRKDKLWYNSLEEQRIYREYYDFLEQWNDESATMEIQTSGSTGDPKMIVVEKSNMKSSARLTCDFLQLNAGDKALLCMPLQYIGAKMMVVRSLVADLELLVREPSGHPLADVYSLIDFAAMTPQQVYNSLQVPVQKEKLLNIKKLIIGGGAIDEVLAAEIATFPNEVYSTYGMTETLSHVAMRQLSGEDRSAYYVPLPSVQLFISEKDTLIIEAPFASEDRIITNDIVNLLPDGRFRVLGRIDNVINSGGVKIQIESVEQKLKPILSCVYAITSIADPKFGETIVLLSEEEISSDKLACMKECLDKYELPRHIAVVNEVPLTGSGKIDRKACKLLARSSF